MNFLRHVDHVSGSCLVADLVAKKITRTVFRARTRVKLIPHTFGRRRGGASFRHRAAQLER